MSTPIFAKISLVAAFVVAALAGPNTAEAQRYKSKGAVAASITKRTGADRSTVVGKTTKGHFYVRSEALASTSRNARGKILMEKSTTKTRLVNKDTGAIMSTSKNHQPAASDAVRRYEATTHGEANVGVHIWRGSMTRQGNQSVQSVTFSANGGAGERIVLLSKTGAVKRVQDSPR